MTTWRQRFSPNWSARSPSGRIGQTVRRVAESAPTRARWVGEALTRLPRTRVTTSRRAVTRVCIGSQSAAPSVDLSRGRTLRCNVRARGFTVKRAERLRRRCWRPCPTRVSIVLSRARERSSAEQHCSCSTALPRIHHGNGKPSPLQVREVAHVTSDSDALTRFSVEGDQGLVRTVVHAGEIFDLPRREVLERRQEPAETRSAPSRAKRRLAPGRPRDGWGGSRSSAAPRAPPVHRLPSVAGRRRRTNRACLVRGAAARDLPRCLARGFELALHQEAGELWHAIR